MALPFEVRKTFTTALSSAEVKALMIEQNNKRNKIRFFWGFNYFGTVDDSGFVLTRYSSQKKIAHPRINGRIHTANPTIVELTITPNYFTIVSVLVWAVILAVVAIVTNGMIINGVLRTPTFNERLLFALGGGGLPMLWCYLNVIFPVKWAESWLKKKLKLQEG